MSTENENRLDHGKITDLEKQVVALSAQVEILLGLIATHMSTTQTPSENSLSIPLKSSSIIDQLTRKQAAVLLIVVSGGSNELIAHLLQCSMSTAKTHVKALVDKVSGRDRYDLIAAVQPILSALSPGDYERITGVPSDWHLDPDQYASITKVIRTKTR